MGLDPIMRKDGYKVDHRRQFPPGHRYTQSNFTPRMSRIPGIIEVPHFGSQFFLKRFLMDDMQEGFFNRPKDVVLDRYKRRIDGYLGPDHGIDFDHIAALHDLGYVPLRFNAIPEGSVVPLRVPMLTVENTHPDFGWLPNFYETLLSCTIWLPCTSAAQARRMRGALEAWARVTGTPQEFVDWQAHDFSMRGMASLEAAEASGAAHLMYFTGTDTLPAIDFIERYYTPSTDDYFIGGSVAATEHAVMCAGGKDDELSTYDRIISLYPQGIVAIVSDTWDLWHVVTETIPTLKDKIMSREGKVVIRPDSGDPVKIICGDPHGNSPEERAGVVELLWNTFGGTYTDEGYKQLDPHIGSIYGDSITFERLTAIMSGLEMKGFASGNTVLGVGSYNYQYQTRDTFGFAMKATWVDVDGEGRNIFKDPITDDGTKKSAKGRLAVVPDGGTLKLINEATPEDEAQSVLTTVWEDGKFVRWDSFDTIRARARGSVLV